MATWYDAGSWDVGLEGGSWNQREAGGRANQMRSSNKSQAARGRSLGNERESNRKTAREGIASRALRRTGQLDDFKADSERREQNLRSSTARDYTMRVNPYSSSNFLSGTQVALDTETAANKQRSADLQIQRDMEMGIEEGKISDAKELQEIGTRAGLGAKEYGTSIAQINTDIREGDYHGYITDNEEGMINLVDQQYARLLGLGLEQEANDLLEYYTVKGNPGYAMIYEQ